MDSCLGTVTEFTFSDRNTDSDVTVMYHDCRIHIDISVENLEKSPTIRDQYLHFLKVADAFELDGLTVDDFYDWILEGCAQGFPQVPPPAYDSTPTLQDYNYAQTFHYTLMATEDDTFILQNRADTPSKHPPFGVNVPEELCTSWPSFEPSQVRICTEFTEQTLCRTPRKVQTDEGKIYFFKPYRYCDGHLARHELQKYHEIRQAKLGDLQVSRLFGLVREKSGVVLGLLLSYIESNAVTLSCAARPDTSLSLRQQWAQQVTHILTALHQAGIIWGDAKPENVLVDIRKNAWIIDFGGGYTQGWVDQEIAGTIQGDLQGLSRIVDYIHK